MLELWIKVHYKVGKYLNHNNVVDIQNVVNLDSCDSANQRASIQMRHLYSKRLLSLVGICSTENGINVSYFDKVDIIHSLNMYSFW